MKDETRRKIILQLHEKDSLSYVDLMKALGIANTGKMNYHLKVLGDLLLKTDDGQYALTEKGKLASRLLLEFPEEERQPQLGMRIKWSDAVWIIISNGLFLVILLYFYYKGAVSTDWLFGSILLFVAVVVFAVILVKMPPMRRDYSPKSMVKGAKIGFILLGASVGMFSVFLGGGLVLVGLVTLLRSAGIRLVLFPFEWWVVISLVLGPTIGGYIGYLIYKKSKYSKITYYDPFA